MLRQLGKISRHVIDHDWLKLPYGEVNVDGKPLRYVESNRLSIKRMQTLITKEPTTIPWLDSFSPDDVFVDIGANVGMYSIYAAVVRGVRVYSFEPEALNYAELNKNIFVNNLHSRVTAYCAALSDSNRVDELHLGGFAEGISHHDFGENTWREDKDFGALKTSKDARLRQGCVAFTLDSLVASGAIPAPDHIKVDVDGLESKVIRGALETIANPKLKTILIEIDHTIPSCHSIIGEMVERGWNYSLSQLRTNRKVIFTEDQIYAMQSKGKGGLNYIFFRDDRYARLFDAFLSDYIPPWGT